MMDRRTFVLLTGATSGALLRPPFQPSTAPTRARGRSGGPAVGRLKFELDEQRRWSIWYYGDGQPVPLIQTAVVGARVGDQLVTLADLEDSTVGNRRPPGGESVVVRGRAARAGGAGLVAPAGGPGARGLGGPSSVAAETDEGLASHGALGLTR